MNIVPRHQDSYLQKKIEAHKRDTTNATVRTIIHNFKALPFEEKTAVIQHINTEHKNTEVFIDQEPELVSLLKTLSKDKYLTVSTILQKNLETEQHIRFVFDDDEWREKNDTKKEENK